MFIDIKTRLLIIVVMTLILMFPALRSNAEPIPDRQGLAVYCIHNIYDKISKAVLLEDDYRILIVPDTVQGACVKGRNMYISYNLVQSLHNTDELACLIGHEIAHIKLGHIVYKKSTDDKMEAEADYWGYRYAVLIGYKPDVCDLLTRNHFPEQRINYLKTLLAR